jgi:hypothetical protein
VLLADEQLGLRFSAECWVMAVEQQIKEYDNQASNEPGLMNVLDRAEKAGAGKAKLEFKKLKRRNIFLKLSYNLTRTYLMELYHYLEGKKKACHLI